MKWLVMLVLLPVLLVVGALWLNRAPLLQAPGPLARLQIYLTTHVAATRRGHERPELRPLVLKASIGEVRERVIEAMQRLHWQQIRHEQAVVRAVVVSPLWRFKDDVEVQLQPTRVGVQVDVRSRSRVGKGDLAANTRHILELYRELEATVE
jgi:uncharacterized protein (DUF1499 family)